VISFVLAVATIVILSVRVSRLNIIRAIRDIAGPPARRKRRWLYIGVVGLSLRLGLAYPLARRGRTGLTVAMYALVVFILTFITSISFMIDKQVDTATADVSGGAQVFVRSSEANH
jgi:hypothetical protein